MYNKKRTQSYPGKSILGTSIQIGYYKRDETQAVKQASHHTVLQILTTMNAVKVLFNSQGPFY